MRDGTVDDMFFDEFNDDLINFYGCDSDDLYEYKYALWQNMYDEYVEAFHESIVEGYHHSKILGILDTKLDDMDLYEIGQIQRKNS